MILFPHASFQDFLKVEKNPFFQFINQETGNKA